MSKGKDLIKNTGILFIGKVSTQFVSFILLPLYTARLSTEAYGTLDLYTTIASILIPIITLELEQAVFRYLLSAEERKETVLSSVVVYLALASVAMLLIYCAVVRIIPIEFAGLVLLYYVTQLFCTVFQQIPRGCGNYTLYATTAFLSSFISIGFSVVFICGFNSGIDGILTARIISQVFVVLFVCWRMRIFNLIRPGYFSIGCLKSMLKYSTPLVFNQMGSWVINYSDRMIIIAVLGVAYNGIYAISNKFFTLITSTMNLFNTAWTESIVKSLHEDNRNKYINDIFSITITLSMIAAAGIIGGIGILFRYFINPSYDDAYYQIPILVYAAMLSGLSANVGSIYVAYKMTKEISTTTVITALVNVIVHVLLIYNIKLYAASISTLVSFLVLLFLRIHRLKRIEKLTIHVDMLFGYVIINLFIVITYYMRNQLFQIMTFALLVLFVLYYLIRHKALQENIKMLLGQFRKDKTL